MHSGSKVNAITSVSVIIFKFIQKLTNVKVEKIDSHFLKIYGMISVKFLLKNNLGKVWFFKKICLLAEISMKVVFEMCFLFFRKVNIKFGIEELTWKKYTIAEVMPIPRWVEVVNKHKFMKIALNKVSKTFVLHISALKNLVLITIVHS